jgi:hypothetical protein
VPVGREISLEIATSAMGQNETSALVLASATSTAKPDIAVAGEKGLTSRLGLQKGSTTLQESSHPRVHAA